MNLRSLILFFLVAALGIGVQAQMGPGRGKCMSNYDPKSEMTISGTVDRVTQENGRMGKQGTHLFVKTETGTLEVHLGPADYIASQQVSFAAGDLVQVTGSKVKVQGNEVVLAREVKKEGKTLVLRNSGGVPNWSRGRRP